MRMKKEYGQIISYLFFGVATTVVNFIVFFLTKGWLNLYVANLISWIAAVLFAYYTNRLFVFKQEKEAHEIATFVKFIVLRILSLAFDMFFMFVFIQLLQWTDFVGKLLTQVIVVILNYFFSKYLIFTESQDS